MPAGLEDDQDPIERQRVAGGDRVDATRGDADSERASRRQAHDRTRQHGRGGQQARASLDRERADDDASLHTEREQSDRVRASDRRVAQQAVAVEADRRAEVERVLDDAVADRSSQGQRLRQALVATRSELADIERLLVSVLKEVPRGPFEGRLMDGAGLIRAAADRIELLLEGVLDPAAETDEPSRECDIGGSG